MICPYCYSIIVLNKDKKCSVCKKEFDKNILNYLIKTKNIPISLIGKRKTGKTSFLSVLFYQIETILSHYNDVIYKFLENNGFNYIIDNVNNIKNGNPPSATSFTDNSNLIVLFKKFYFRKNLIFLYDTPGEFIENDDLLINSKFSKKVFNSEVLFFFIDSEDLFNGDGMLYTGFVSKFLQILENNSSNIKDVYLIFTKSDKIFNFMYRFEVFNNYREFCFNLKKGVDLEEAYNKLNDFSKEFNKVISSYKHKNFFSLLNEKFNVEIFFVSSLGGEKFDLEQEFGTLAPLIHLMGKNYYHSLSGISNRVFKFIKRSIFNGN